MKALEAVLTIYEKDDLLFTCSNTVVTYVRTYSSSFYIRKNSQLQYMLSYLKSY